MDQTIGIKLKVSDTGSVVLDKFSASLARMETHAKGVGQSLNLIKWDSIINLGERVFRTGEQIYRMGRNVTSALDEINRLSKIAGMSTDAFQKMTYAAKMTDVGAGDLATGIKKLSMGMEDASRGTGEAGKWFDVMGISVKDVTGNLRPLDQVMGQIASKFAQWEDGPRKIAIAVDLFGRSGQNLIPYLNQGAAGLKKFYEEAERLGIVLDESLIRRGSEIDDTLKRIGASASAMWKRTVVGAYEAIDAIATFELKAFGYAWGPFMGGREIPGQEGLVGPKSWDESLPVKAKTQPPGVAGAAAKAITYTSSQIFGSMQEEGRWLSWWQGINKEMDHTPDLVEAIGAEIAQITREYEALGKIAIEANEKMTLAWGAPSADEILAEIDKVIAAEEKLGEAAVNRMELQESTWKMAKPKLNEMAGLWESLGESMSNAWASNLTNIIRSTESTSEKIKSFFQGIGDAFLSIVSQMIAKWLIFGNLTGQSQAKGGGWGGVLGLVTKLFHAGGIVGESSVPGRPVPLAAFMNAPKLHAGFMPEEYPAILRRGEGVFTPEQMKALGSMKGLDSGERGNTYNTYIEATDVDSFARRYGNTIEGIYFKGKRFNKMAMR